MSQALIAALVFTAALLVTHAYFLLGSVPLLVLKHDTPTDSRFVRSFFNTYYLLATYTASATAVCLAFAGRSSLAAGAAGLALLAVILRRTVVPKMDALHAQLSGSDTGSVAAFRRIHMTAILLNLAQLMLIVWSLISASIQSRAGV